MPQSLKKYSWSVFVLIILCFLMPFLDLSCSGQKIVSLSGINLVVGASLEDEYSGYTDEETRIEPEGLAIIAFLAALGGLGLSFLKTSLPAAITAGVGFVATLALKFKIDNDISSQGEGMFSAEYRIGYWLVLLLFLAATALYAYFVTQRAAPQAADVFCIKCGAKNPAGSKFCISCGERM